MKKCSFYSKLEIENLFLCQYQNAGIASGLVWDIWPYRCVNFTSEQLHVTDIIFYIHSDRRRSSTHQTEAVADEQSERRTAESENSSLILSSSLSYKNTTWHTHTADLCLHRSHVFWSKNTRSTPSFCAVVHMWKCVCVCLMVFLLVASCLCHRTVWWTLNPSKRTRLSVSHRWIWQLSVLVSSRG